MSDVYEAVQNRLGRTVALKVRRPHKPEHDGKLHERFVHSIRLHSTLSHSNIVRVIDLLHEHGADIAVLEFLSGPSLDIQMKSEVCLSLKDVLRVGYDMGQALDCVHQNGIVHRDVKPSNIMYADSTALAELKLMDFGVAKGGSDTGELTVRGAQLGTLWYMPPEQLAGQTPTPAWDVFALGVSLAELWVGELPLKERSQSAVFRRHLDGEAIPAWSSEHRSQASELCDLLDAMLETNLKKRLKSLAVFNQVVRALGRVYSSSVGSRSPSKSLSLDVLEQNLSALSEPASLRLKRLLNRNANTQEITTSIDRRSFVGESAPSDLDDTMLTDSIRDDESDN